MYKLSPYVLVYCINNLARLYMLSEITGFVSTENNI